ncbi:MAG: DUF2079 domain-containing protein [Acidimicrobiales bacterium]
MAAGTKAKARSALAHMPIAALVTTYIVSISILSINLYSGYNQPPFDMAVFDQGIWLLSRFHVPFVTVMGRNLFGDHTSFVLLLFVPLYWIWPHVQLLLVLQAVLIGCAVIPIYCLALRCLKSVSLATALGAAYLLNPALLNGNIEQFHPECVLVLSVSTALYAAICSKKGLLIASVIISLLVKEDVGLLMVPLGIWVALRRDRILGIIIAVTSAIYMAACFLLIIPAFLGVPSIYLNRLPFGGFFETIKTALVNPRAIFDYVGSGKRPYYVWQMGLSFGFGFCWAPDVALVAFLTLAENLISTFQYMQQILYHYSLSLVPVLAIATVVGVGRVGALRDQRLLTTLVLASAVIAGLFWGPTFSSSDHFWRPTRAQVTAINTLIRKLPPAADVSAYYPFVAHIDHRVNVYMWPTPFKSLDYGVSLATNGKRLSFANQVQYLLLPTNLVKYGANPQVFKHVSGQFTVVAVDDGFELLKRT